MKATYEIFHAELGIPERDLCAKQINEVLGKRVPRLGTPTVYLRTFEEAEEYLQDSPISFVHIPAYVKNGGSFPPTSGAMGVWISNYLAYKKFLETDNDILFLFEDDAMVSENFFEVASSYYPQLPENWDFWALFVPDDCRQWYFYPRANQPWVRSNDGGPTTYDMGLPDVCRNYQDWSCAGYAVSRKGAELAVADVEANGISNPIDWYIFNVRHLDSQTQYFDTYSIKPSSYKPVRLFQSAHLSSSIGITQAS